MQTNHCKIYQLTVQSRQMLANRDGVLQMGILQMVADGALWRETILMFWDLLAQKLYLWHNCNVEQVHMLTDNSTALTYINNVGGIHSVICNNIAKCIWEFAQKRDFWISSSHISAVENTMTDKMSRVFNDNTEWMLFNKLFKILIDRFQFNPQVSLFATRLNE